MFRLIPATVALATLGFFLATPQASQAQPVGVQVQVGPIGFSYGQGVYTPGYTYVPPRVIVPAPVVTAPVVTAPGVVTAPVIVTRPAFYPWFWDGHHWVRHERYGHYIHHHR